MPLNMPVSEQLASNWGRAAVSRFTKTPEEIQAEIIRALEGKLSVEFKDYSQWQRVPLPQPPLLPPQKTVVKTKPKKTSLPRPLTGVSGTSCSSLCLHPWNKRLPPVDHTAEIESKERIAILTLQIDAKKKSVHQYRELCDLLSKQNQSLQAEIDKVSSNAHKTVTQLLEKYEEYSGASKALRRAHIEDELQAQRDLDITSEQLSDERSNLENEVLNLDTQLKDLQQDLQVLRTYKDKEYPVKSMQISKLRKSVVNVAQEQKNERHELERITAGESVKLHNSRETRIKDIMESAAETAFVKMVPAGLQHMAWHNTVLKLEIEEQRRGVLDCEDEIYGLKKEIKELKRAPQSYVRPFVFPEAFLPKKICAPDEDIILDIPTQQLLPL
ncbi:uncharacterized protein C20orf96-like isoform X1 [Styela clava]